MSICGARAATSRKLHSEIQNGNLRREARRCGGGGGGDGTLRSCGGGRGRRERAKTADGRADESESRGQVVRRASCAAEPTYGLITGVRAARINTWVHIITRCCEESAPSSLKLDCIC